MMLGSFRLGRWFGFEVRIDYSWFLIFALVIWTFSAQVFPAQLPGYGSGVYFVMGLAGALLLFASVLLHEFSHSIVARTRGIRVEGITLFIFGGVARTSMEAERAIDEFLLTIVGPLTSLALAALFYGVDVLVDFLAWPRALAEVAAYLAVLNLMLAIFNMIPGFPLDGGRIFRSAVWHFTGDLEKATRWATAGGRAFGYLLMGVGILEVFGMLGGYGGGALNGMWLAFIGWFLSSAATSSYRQFALRHLLSRVAVREVMSEEPVTLSPDVSLEDVAQRFFLRHAARAYPVVEDGRLVGLLPLEEVSGVSPDRRAAVTVREAMHPVESVPTIGAEETAEAALVRMQESPGDRILVVRNGEFRGVLTSGDLASWVERARELGMTREAGDSGPGGET